MIRANAGILPYTSVFIKLLKGPVEYFDKSTWEKLLLHKYELTEFLASLGLSLVLDEQDGYAVVRQMLSDDESVEISWVTRRAYSYEESILLVLLREMMAEFEISESGSRELIRRRREIKEYAELFFREKASRVKFLKELDRLIDRAEENGFLSRVEDSEVEDEQKFRVRKLIKAKVDEDALSRFHEQLRSFIEEHES
ncbi:DUF4194 domain-containing protein [Arcticibacter sp. MXS-1]|uniref:DUF4194 domain-containing protein n=1 Tax=Arcticibacter sp. MXS-1 TaxID=3341726 RepID=UPI0035A81C5C